MRNENNPFAQGGINSTFAFFLGLWEKCSKNGGKRVPRLRGPKAHTRISWEVFLTEAKFQICRRYGLNKWLVLFLTILNKLFSTSQIGSSLGACAFPTSPFSIVDDELIAKSLAQTLFITFEDKNGQFLVKPFLITTTLKLKTASNRVFGL